MTDNLKRQIANNLEKMVGIRGESMLILAKYIIQGLINSNVLEGYIAIIEGDDAANFEKNNPNNSYLTIPYNKTKYEENEAFDFNLISVLRIGEEIYGYINLYYLIDNKNKYYITEVSIDYE